MGLRVFDDWYLVHGTRYDLWSDSKLCKERKYCGNTRWQGCSSLIQTALAQGGGDRRIYTQYMLLNSIKLFDPAECTHASMMSTLHPHHGTTNNFTSRYSRWKVRKRMS